MNHTTHNGSRNSRNARTRMLDAVALDALEPIYEDNCAHRQALARAKRYQDFEARWIVEKVPGYPENGKTLLQQGAFKLLHERFTAFDKTLPDVTACAKRTIKRMLLAKEEKAQCKWGISATFSE